MSDRSIKFVLELFQNRCLKVFSKLSQSCRVALKLSQMFQVVLKCWPCSSQVVPKQNQRTLQGPKCHPCCSQLLILDLVLFYTGIQTFWGKAQLLWNHNHIPKLVPKLVVLLLQASSFQCLLCHLDKVNRCLARYSPRATTTKRPINRAPNRPAWPGPNWPKMPIWAKFSCFWAKNPFFYRINQKFCYLK